jgi:hypothetical protein
MTHRMSINVTHLYGDEDGETHLSDIELLVDDTPAVPGGAGMVHLELPATTAILTEYLKKDYAPEVLHCAPRPQLVLCLQGSFEVTTTSGDTRQFGPGDWMLADDVGSKGHITRTVGDGPRLGLAIGLPEGWTPSAPESVRCSRAAAGGIDPEVARQP